jgi:ABC-2 type transport system ATP-binding protein
LDPLGIRRMKATILTRAQNGACIILSSHLLHLVQEICSRILILKEGRKVMDGSIEEISAGIPELKGDLNLEKIFLNVTGSADEGSGK